MSRGERSVYTAPIKALVSREVLRPRRPARLRQRRHAHRRRRGEPRGAGHLLHRRGAGELGAARGARPPSVGQVVMDEFHFYADPERGWAWQVPILELPQAQFLLMSATLGDVSFFAEDLTRRTGRETAVVAHTERPVPLSFRYARTPLHETITELLAGQQAPVYVVHTTQAAAIEQAQALMSLNVSSKAEKERIAELIGAFRFTAGFGKTLSRLVRHGIGVHHAGMLPKYRRLVETLAQAGPAQAHLRHRHPRRRHQRPDPHGAVHRADQVRRPARAPPAGPRVPPGRRPGGPRRARRRRLRRRPGPRARGGERQAPGEGGRRRQEAAARRADQAARGLRLLVGEDPREAHRGPARGADQPVPGVDGDAAAGRRASGGRSSPRCATCSRTTTPTARPSAG